MEKISKTGECCFCKSIEFTRLKLKDIESNVICDSCRAIFYSTENNDKQKAGLFTGRYAGFQKQSIYKNNFVDKNPEDK